MKMSKKFSLLFFISLAISIASCFLLSRKTAVNDLLTIYRQNIALENHLISSLSFSLAGPHEQFNTFEKGWGDKLVLRDDLGNLWIFKEEGDNPKAIEVYRLFKLLGINTPAVFRVALPINGKMVLGTVQKMLSDAVSLDRYLPAALSQESLDQLLKMHIADWLVSNCDSAGGNFLLTFDKAIGSEQVFRIDNNSAFAAFGIDELREDYAAPWFLNSKENYYSLLWDAFKKDWIRLAFEEPYNLGIFISNLPDDLFLEILGASLHFSFSRDQVVRKKYRSLAEYKKALIARKHNLPAAIRNFYAGLCLEKGIILSLPVARQNSFAVWHLQEMLKKYNLELKGRIKSIAQSKKKEQKEINVIASHKAWQVIYWFIVNSKIEFVSKNRGRLQMIDLPAAWRLFERFLAGKFISEYDHLSKQLRKIHDEATNENEKTAIDRYLEQLDSIKNNDGNLFLVERVISPEEAQ